MLNKTFFKRVALAIVAAMGVGLLSGAPANATPHSFDVLTVGTPSLTSVAAGETVSVTIDYSWTSTNAGESATILLGGDATGFGSVFVVANQSDSANVGNHVTINN